MCPTCSETMQCLAEGSFGSPGVFWCPRCGTVRLQTDIPSDRTGNCVPKLVGRCREFYASLTNRGAMIPGEWFSLGIHDSINTPENRP